MERTTNRVEIEYSPGLRLLLVRPDDAEGPLPVIVWVHGGGWRSGDRHDSPDLHEYFARHGFAMVSIDYRLAPHSIFPAQLLDVRSALRWIRVNSLEHGLNPDSVGLWGASAGGHLAALAGLMASIPTLPEESATGGVSAAVHSVVTGY
ncbi:MAG: Isoprenylcysteine alpha-carbonyl methylesterase, partial [Cryobacterium sp.]|nr:Isoprenylcysteine alpha-carbonyl methylesterase [Cryobacterium sp.]